MNDEFEIILKNLPLVKPSEQLDRNIEDIIAGKNKETVKKAQIIKFITYAAAACLFLSIGVAEIYRRTKDDSVKQQLSDKKAPITPVKEVKAEAAIKVSTSESSDNFLQGDIVQLENGMLVRPVIRQIIVKKTYFDSKTNTQIVVEEPQNEIFYVPLQVD